MRCVFLAALSPKLNVKGKYRHYYTADISNFADGAPLYEQITLHFLVSQYLHWLYRKLNYLDFILL